MIQSNVIPKLPSGYDIGQSLRFNDDDSAYLSRTFTTATTFSINLKVKRGNLGSIKPLFSSSVKFNANDTFTAFGLTTTAVFRDTASWYYIHISNNGLVINGFNYGSVTTSSLVNPLIGSDGSNYFDGYIAEFHYIEATTTYDEFGELDATYGHFKPIRYTSSYGANDFFLKFSNGGNIGEDSSGNGNNFTATNLSATDIVLDSPTNNFCVLNTLMKDGILLTAYNDNVTISEGNTKASTSSTAYDQTLGSIGMNSGKWYWEVYWVLVSASTSNYVGVYSNPYDSSLRSAVTASGSTINIDTSMPSFTTGSLVRLAIDFDAGTFGMAVNDGSFTYGAMTNYNGETLFPAQGNNQHILVANFGQDSSFAGNKTPQGYTDANGIGDFYYQPPEGYLALCAKNLPEPTVVPSENFDVVTYVGTGSTQSITGLEFQPDLVWIKSRTGGTKDHNLYDLVRGTEKALFSSGTYAEATINGVTSFEPNGFAVGSYSGVNTDSEALVAWNWKAGGTPVVNNDGTITSQVSANVDAGFSIVSFDFQPTGNQTIGHGLSTAPDMIIMKSRDSSADAWWVYHTSIGASNYLRLNTTDVSIANSAVWGTDPTASVFTIGSLMSTSNYGTSQIAYCFHSVEGYSKIGSYVGNGSADGTFAYCGFRPRYVMIKRTDSTGNWIVVDIERGLYNSIDDILYPNLSNAEASNSTLDVDFTSNGFKLRTTDATMNASGGVYLFMSFASYPFKFSNAQ